MVRTRGGGMGRNRNLGTGTGTAKGTGWGTGAGTGRVTGIVQLGVGSASLVVVLCRGAPMRANGKIARRTITLTPIMPLGNDENSWGTLQLSMEQGV